MNIDPTTIIRAWRDPKFAASLPDDVRRALPHSPAGPDSVGNAAEGDRVGPHGTTHRTCNTIDRTCNTIDRTCNTIDRTCNTIDRTCNTIDRTCNTIDRTCNTIDRTCNSIDSACRNASVDAAYRAGAALTPRPEATR